MRSLLQALCAALVIIGGPSFAAAGDGAPVSEAFFASQIAVEPDRLHTQLRSLLDEPLDLPRPVTEEEAAIVGELAARAWRLSDEVSSGATGSALAVARNRMEAGIPWSWKPLSTEEVDAPGFQRSLRAAVFFQAGLLVDSVDGATHWPLIPKRRLRPIDVLEEALAGSHGLELPADLNRLELMALVENVHFEARGEPLLGRIAVAFVTLNRVRDARWADSISGVVRAHAQFSWTLDDPLVRDFDAFRESAQAALMVLSGSLEDPTAGATHFYAPALVAKPAWARRLVQTAFLGGHRFLKGSDR